MPTIKLTPEAKLTLETRAGDRPYWDNTTPRPDGDYDIVIPAKTYNRLTQLMLPGETYSELILRLARLSRRAHH